MMSVKRVLRGGSWNNKPRNVRSAVRNNNSGANNNIGFRVAVRVNTPQSENRRKGFRRECERSTRHHPATEAMKSGKSSASVRLVALGEEWTDALKSTTQIIESGQE